jgi:hypothetical protein
MDGKRPDETLEQFLERIPESTFVEVPLESITKDEYKRMLGHPRERILELTRTSSNRDLVIESFGIVLEPVVELLATAVRVDMRHKLFGKGGRITSDDARIELAYGLGLISKDDCSNLQTLRGVRNAFAHDPDLHHFEHDSKVLGAVRSMPIGAPAASIPLPPRDRIMITCVCLLQSLADALQARIAQELPSPAVPVTEPPREK